LPFLLLESQRKPLLYNHSQKQEIASPIGINFPFSFPLLDTYIRQTHSSRKAVIDRMTAFFVAYEIL
jgi:hypothetical protein